MIIKFNVNSDYKQTIFNNWIQKSIFIFIRNNKNNRNEIISKKYKDLYYNEISEY